MIMPDDDAARSADECYGDPVLPSCIVAPTPVSGEHHTPGDANVDKRKHYTFRGGYRGRTALYHHQAVGVSVLSNTDAHMLADDQGLGKTVQALYALCARIKRREIDGVVVLCYHRHVGVWLDNIEQHEPRLLPYVQVLADLPQDKRQYDLKKRVWIVNYEILARAPKKGQSFFRLPGPATNGPGIKTSKDVHRLRALLCAKRVAVVCDESQSIRTPTSRTFRIVTNLGAYAAARYTLTGTPVAERSWDLWAQLFYLDHGATLGKSFAAYIARYAVVRQTRYGTRPVRGKNLDELNVRVRRIITRRLKDDCLDLPGKTVHYVPALLDGKDRTYAENLQDAVLRELGEAIPEGGELALSSIDAACELGRHLARLDVLPAMPKLVDASLSRGVKYDFVTDAIDQARCPVIVWCIHRAVARAFTDELLRDGIRADMISGAVPMAKRPPIVKAFREGKLDALVCTCATMRDGFTLVESNRTVYVQRDYNQLNWTQSQDRVCRIGQTRPVLIDVLVSDLGLDLHHGCVLTSKQAEFRAALQRTDAGVAQWKVTANSLREVLALGRHDYAAYIRAWRNEGELT